MRTMGKTKQTLIRGGYKVEPVEMDICPCIVAGYSHGTASFGIPYVMVIDYEKRICGDINDQQGDNRQTRGGGMSRNNDNIPAWVQLHPERRGDGDRG